MKYKISALTGVGKLEYYEEFIDRYFNNRKKLENGKNIKDGECK